MREYGVEVCSEECGVTRVGWHKHWSFNYYDKDNPDETAVLATGFFKTEGHCPACGTRVGICPKRGPWRERMVPRGTLEWLVARRGEGGCPFEWDHHCWAAKNPDELCTPDLGKDGYRKCWIEAALTATGEADDE